MDTSLMKGITFLMGFVLFFLDKKKEPKKIKDNMNHSVHLSGQRHHRCSGLILIAGWLCCV